MYYGYIFIFNSPSMADAFKIQKKTNLRDNASLGVSYTFNPQTVPLPEGWPLGQTQLSRLA